MRRFVIVCAVVTGLVACKKDGDKANPPAPATAPGTMPAGSMDPASAQLAQNAAALAQNAAAAANNAAAAANNAAAAANTAVAGIPRPANITDAHVAAANAMFAAFEKASAGLAAAGQDCAKAAAALTAVQADFMAAQAKFSTLKGDLTDDASEQWVMMTYAPRMQTAMAPFMAASLTCANNAAFAAAVGNFDLDP